MAYSTQRYFMKFDSLEAPDECVTGIKQYLSCLDSRAWSMDPIQRNLYLKDQIGCGPSLVSIFIIFLFSLFVRKD